MLKVHRLDTLADQVLARGPVDGNGPGRRDVVRRDRVAQHGEDPRAPNVLRLVNVHLQVQEVRRLADVGGVRVPLE